MAFSPKKMCALEVIQSDHLEMPQRLLAESFGGVLEEASGSLLSESMDSRSSGDLWRTPGERLPESFWQSPWNQSSGCVWKVFGDFFREPLSDPVELIVWRLPQAFCQTLKSWVFQKKTPFFAPAPERALAKHSHATF
jgi:hypothetical protein